MDTPPAHSAVVDQEDSSPIRIDNGPQTDSDDDEPDPAAVLCERLRGLHDPEGQLEGDALTPLEAAIVILDWMHTYKVTNVAADSMWRIIKMLMPESLNDAPSFRSIRELVCTARGCCGIQVEVRGSLEGFRGR